MIKQASTSIHNIISQNKKVCSQAQIKRLFQRVTLPTFDLSEFTKSKLMSSSQHFVFFVQELQSWNKKIGQQKNSPFSHSQFNRNSFIFSSLRSACIKNRSQVQQTLKNLSKWFIKNSYNVPQPSILMKVYNPNEQWEVRKTFRSNTPFQINDYKRRFLCVGDYKQNNMLFTENKVDNKKDDKVCAIYEKKNQNKCFSTLIQKQQHDKNRLLKMQYKNMFKSRQEEQLARANSDFNLKKNRFSQSVSKKFYQGKFQKNSKQLYYSGSRKSRNIRTVETNRKNIQNQSILLESIKKKRLNTSLGIRITSNIQEHSRNRSQFQKTDINQQDKFSFINNLIQELKLKNDDKFLEVSGQNLMSNPFQKKDKLKKQRKKK